MFTFLGVFSRAVRIFTLFPDVNLTCKPVLLSQTNLYIFGKKLGFVSQNGLDRFALVHLVIKGSYSYRLRTTTLNVKLEKTNQAAYSSDSYRHRTENTGAYGWKKII